MTKAKLDPDRVRGQILDNATDFGLDREQVNQLLEALDLEQVTSNFEVEATLKVKFFVDLSDYDVELGDERNQIEEDASWLTAGISAGFVGVNSDWQQQDLRVQDLIIREQPTG